MKVPAGEMVISVIPNLPSVGLITGSALICKPKCLL